MQEATRAGDVGGGGVVSRFAVGIKKKSELKMQKNVHIEREDGGDEMI